MVAVLVLAVCCLLPFPALAQEQGGQNAHEEGGIGKRWSFGLTAASYRPDLRQINDVLINPQLALLQDPNFLIPRNQDTPAEVRNIGTPPLTNDLSYGVEAQWEWKPRVSVVFMVLNWQGRTQLSDTITMSLRSNLPPIDVPRTARYNLNVNQLWWGWRYALFDDPGKGRIFANIGLIGLAVADFTMDSLLKVNETALGLNFASISSTEVHASGFTSRYGLGGEYFVKENASFGFHVNYVFGELNDFKVSRFFPSGFSELPPIPPQTTNSLPEDVLPPDYAVPVEGETLQVADIVHPREGVERVVRPRDVVLDLDGWDIGFTFRFYY